MTSVSEIVYDIDGKCENVVIADLLNGGLRDELRERIKQAESHVCVHVNTLLDLSDADRFHFIDFACECGSSLTFRIGDDKQYDNLFETALAMLVVSEDLPRHQRGKVAVLEIAVIYFPDALESACDRIIARMRELGIKGVDRRKLLKEADNLKREIDTESIASTAYSQCVGNIFELADWPEIAALVVPARWRLTTQGVARAERAESILTPIIISGRQKDLHTGVESVTLLWYRDDQWQERVVNRTTIATARLIVDELSQYGVNVTSSNAKDLVDYLSESEATNLAQLPKAIVTNQLGWVGERGKSGFLLGHDLITPRCAESKTDSPNQKTIFRGADAGDDQIAAGFCCEGDYQKWLQGITLVKDCPQIMLAMYASLAAPLLAIFETPNFLVSLAGPTSCGKTTAVRIAASVWGNPNEQAATSVVKTWSSTATWRERVPAVLNNLPFFLDDSKHVTHREDVAKTIYGVVQGLGKGRGTIKGLARQMSWKTVAIATGEQCLSSFSSDGGTRPRVLSLWGSPFGGIETENGKLARKVDLIVRQNYGHAGRQFIEYLMTNHSKWGSWQNGYDKKVNFFQTRSANAGIPIAGRMAPYFAVIWVAAKLAHHCFKFDGKFNCPIDPLWQELTDAVREADRAAVALQFLYSWIGSHRDEFQWQRDSGKSAPVQGWAGIWRPRHQSAAAKKKGEKNPEEVCFYRNRLDEILRAGEFEPDATLRAWRDKEWLCLNSGDDGKQRLSKRVNVGGGKSQHMIVIRYSTFEENCQE